MSAEPRVLRILFLAGRDALHSQAGGGDVQAFAWAKWAASQGHKVVFFCQSDRELPASEVLDGVRIVRAGKGVILALRAWRHYRANRQDYDLLYEDPIGAGRTPYLAPIYSKVPVIAVWHQVSRQLLQALHPYLVAAGLARIEHVIARFYRKCWLWVPSKERGLEVEQALGFEHSRIRVIPPTIPAASIDRTVRDPSDLVLFLGVLRRYKSVDDLVGAFEIVVRTKRHARLVIAGRSVDTRYEAELAQMVIDRGLEGHASIETNLEPAEKEVLLRDACVLVLPSLLEGFGIVTLEANAVGTPVIVSSGVPASAVIEGYNGLRYEHGDVASLARCLDRMLSDRALRKQLSESSVEHASRFTTDVVAVEFEQLIEQALAG